MQTITDAVNSGNSQSFSYDNLQRLTQAAGGYGAFGFTYDKDGNRLSQTQGIETTNYGYGAASDLLATLSVGGVQTQAIGYSADGRIANLNPGIQAPGGQYITSLSYNQDARLSAVNASSGAQAGYTYDGFGQRLIKTISGTNGEIYQYGQNGMLLEETNASGVAQADYIYLNGRPVAVLNGSTIYFLEPVYDLVSSSLRKARWTICRLVFSLRSQFFHSRRHFSSQAKLRSTIQRFGSTTKACSSLRLTTCTVASIRAITPSAKGWPV